MAPEKNVLTEQDTSEKCDGTLPPQDDLGTSVTSSNGLRLADDDSTSVVIPFLKSDLEMNLINSKLTLMRHFDGDGVSM